MTIGFVTTRLDKFAAAQAFWQQAPAPWPLTHINADTPEIQSTNNQEVAAYSAQWAANYYQQPVIKEDIGFFIPALRGFPGPYLRHMEEWLQIDGFLQLLDKITDRTAYYQLSVGFCHPGGEPQVFSSTILGHVRRDLPPTSLPGYVMDFLFIPKGFKCSINELVMRQRFVRPHDHYQQLLEWLIKTEKPGLVTEPTAETTSPTS